MHNESEQKLTYQLEKISASCTITQVYRALSGTQKSIMECLDKHGNQFSFICADPYQELIGNASTCTLTSHIHQTSKTYACQALDLLPSVFPKKSLDLPFPFTGGALGYIGYDHGRYTLGLHEKLPDDLQMPDVHLLFYRDIVVFDHQQNCIFLLAVQTDNEDDQALANRLEKMRAEMETATLKTTNELQALETTQFTADISKEAFISNVERLQQKMREHDVSQVVLSQRMKAAFPGDPFDFYVKLRKSNPSPYMFHMDFESYTILGASPESVLETRGRQVFTNPIAGTYPRGTDEHSDKGQEAALLADPKEKAEHEMLISRCKQDLAKVCQQGSIQIPAYMHIKRYEHVMHIVSDVTATLQDNVSSIDALLACLPAGTVSGNPKTKAMQIISELENQKRGVYGGGIGYVNFNHNLNFALAIRMLVVKEKTAYLQAGAGIVGASVPQKEYEETLHKAKSLLQAGGGTAIPKHIPTTERKTQMKSYLEKLIANHDLTQSEMRDAITMIFDNRASDSQIAAFMIALGKKGETPEEIAGMAEIIRQHSSQASSTLVDMMDNCGTGGDQSQSFNISTAAAFVLAGAGVTIAKHGNRSISSKTGSADVLEALGVPLDLEKAQIEEILAENNIAFLYAPHVHQRLGQITKVRKELGIPTIFNLMGPLTNPMLLSTQFMGIYRRDMLETMTKTLQQLGRKRAIVINGAGHMDEASLAGSNHLCLLENDSIRKFTLHPNEVGLPVYSNEAIKGGSTRENMQILLDVLRGKPGACLDTVIFNAAIALFANGKVLTIQEGTKLAKESIDSGAAMEKLQFLIKCKARYQSIS